MIFILNHGFLKTTADKSPVNMEPKGSTSRNEPVPVTCLKTMKQT